MKRLIRNIEIINEGLSYTGSLLIDNDIIAKVLRSGCPGYGQQLAALSGQADIVLEGKGKTLLPGVIDDQVHFRQPGATQKADIASESAAAALGGVTSFMDMPNNTPPACSIEALEKKYGIAAETSSTNYSFYLGADNDNIEEIRRMDPHTICGVKVFMGSSTGKLLVDNRESLEKIFRNSPTLIALHCEDNATIDAHLKEAVDRYGDEIPTAMHPVIRSREACIKSSRLAIELAEKHHARIHILHISTEEEIDALRSLRKAHPYITGEVCVHYMWLCDKDYPRLGTRMKCNPAIKQERDMLAIRQAVKEGVISAVATDHAPHLLSEKENCYRTAPSGLPLIQHSLQIMMELAYQGIFTREEVVEAMCHAPARCFGVEKRGFIREGYFADLTLVEYGDSVNYRVGRDNIAYKCGWSPLEGESFHCRITDTFINGTPVVQDGALTGQKDARRLLFDNKDER